MANQFNKSKRTKINRLPARGYYDKETIFSKKAGHEEIVITNEAVYLYCPHGYGTSKLNNNFFENKLKVQASTRNWKTTNALLELVNSI